METKLIYFEQKIVFFSKTMKICKNKPTNALKYSTQNEIQIINGNFRWHF